MVRNPSEDKDLKSKKASPRAGAKKAATTSSKISSKKPSAGVKKPSVSPKAKAVASKKKKAPASRTTAKAKASGQPKGKALPAKPKALTKKVSSLKAGNGFARNVGTGKAMPRLANKRKDLQDSQNKASRRPRETKKMKQRRSVLAAVMEARISLLKRERQRPAETPSVFKLRSRKATPVVFSLEEVQAILKAKNGNAVQGQTHVESVLDPGKKKEVFVEEKKGPHEHRVLGAASIQDILGFNPKSRQKNKAWNNEIQRVPKKWLPYYRSLVKLRDHFHSELSMHAEDSLKKSVVEDLGDNQDLNDGSSESCNRDLVLSLVSSEQEALYEIDEAIQRILNNSYGVCEVTQRPIARERLSAVPFTRYSLEGQAAYERSKRKESSRSGGSVFAAGGDDDAPIGLSRDDIDDE